MGASLPGGMSMLFRKKIKRACSYCARGTKLEEGMVLCTKKGVRSEENKCWRFQYDPCKRIPLKAKAVDFAKYSQEDFSL